MGGAQTSGLVTYAQLPSDHIHARVLHPSDTAAEDLDLNDLNLPGDDDDSEEGVDGELAKIGREQKFELNAVRDKSSSCGSDVGPPSRTILSPSQKIISSRLNAMVEGKLEEQQKLDGYTEEERRAMRIAEVEAIKQYLESDPARFRRLMASRKERQHMFKEQAEMTRRILVARGLTYGNQMIQMIAKAKDSHRLVLRSMGLQAMPPEVERLRGLVAADLTNNLLTALGKALLRMDTLEVLNLSRNEVEFLPEELSLPNLRPVPLATQPCISGCGGPLTGIFTFLLAPSRIMHAGFNQLRTLPRALTNSTRLEVLVASNNKITDLPSALAFLPLTDLYLSENRLREVPVAVLGLKRLQKLSLACNSLSMLPEDMSQLTELQFLDVSFNMLTKLPAQLSELTALERINASFNPLGPVFPEVLVSMTWLVELNLDFTGICNIPPGIGRMKQLLGLQLEGNKLDHPADVLYAKNPLLCVSIYDPSTEELDLSGCTLRQLPLAIGTMSYLRSLDLRNNKLETLPLELGLCTKITRLELAGNDLDYPFSWIIPVHGDMAAMHLLNMETESIDLSRVRSGGMGSLPRSGLFVLNPRLLPLDGPQCDFDEVPELLLAHREKLFELNLSDNHIKALPLNFAVLSGLRVLNLDGNGISRFPDCLFVMTKLESLSLSNNDLEELSIGIGRLNRLTALYVQSNRLTELPETIGRLSSLQVLSCANNKIRRLPDLASFPDLAILDFAANEIGEIPFTIGEFRVLGLPSGWRPASSCCLNYGGWESKLVRGLVSNIRDAAEAGDARAADQPDQKGARDPGQLRQAARALALQQRDCQAARVPGPGLPGPARSSAGRQRPVTAAACVVLS